MEGAVKYGVIGIAPVPGMENGPAYIISFQAQKNRGSFEVKKLRIPVIDLTLR